MLNEYECAGIKTSYWSIAMAHRGMLSPLSVAVVLTYTVWGELLLFTRTVPAVCESPAVVSLPCQNSQYLL